jgi:hypothetical protein
MPSSRTPAAAVQLWRVSVPGQGDAAAGERVELRNLTRLAVWSIGQDIY